MTKKLYWDEPYSREFKAQVVRIDANNAVLDQSLFYPKGGGVGCDTGQLNALAVIETTKVGDEILHHLSASPSFGLGETVVGQVDWDRRYRLMRMHTAGHLLSSILYSKADCRITGNQIDTDRSRMDFNLEAFDRSLLEGFVEEANRLIAEDAPVKTYFLSREEAMKIPELIKLAEASPPNESTLRIVEIAGIDRQADGGLHVSQLKEIGQIRLLKLENKGKNNRRLYYDVNPEKM